MLEHRCGLPARRRTFLTLAAGALAGVAMRPTASPAAAPAAAPSGQARPGAYAGPDLVGEVTPYLTNGEETLLEVARAYNLGVPELLAANPGVDPWVPGRGTRLLLPTAHILPTGAREGILVNVSELRLYYFPPGGGVETFSIGVGREGLGTPMGATRVVRKQTQPTWRPTAEARADKPWLPATVPPGPDNPMGEFALYLGWPTYAVHGTNKPYAVGRRVSRGCIRLYPEGIEKLFAEVPVGTKVAVVSQPFKLTRQDGELWLQAKPDLEQVDELEETYKLTPKPIPLGDARSLIEAKAGPDAARIDWAVVESELSARRGIPVAITNPALAAELPGPSAAEDGLAATAQEGASAGVRPAPGFGIY